MWRLSRFKEAKMTDEEIYEYAQEHGELLASGEWGDCYEVTIDGKKMYAEGLSSCSKPLILDEDETPYHLMED
jgi:hypothetical protein